MSEKIAVGDFLEAEEDEDHQGNFVVRFKKDGKRAGTVCLASVAWRMDSLFFPESDCFTKENLRTVAEFMEAETKRRREEQPWNRQPSVKSARVAGGGFVAETWEQRVEVRLARLERDIGLAGDLLKRCADIEARLLHMETFLLKFTRYIASGGEIGAAEADFAREYLEAMKGA
ncbi:MAG TPA: hypothetical protein DCP69_06770 [Candidatus Omnitrophica bacterium]|nr:hypothetical protein [Candidatus Omnitrophota bacterium]